MRPHQKLRLTREELYDRIWKTPLRDVAPTLGISDVGLKKVCKRHGIPTPPQGYHLMSPGPERDRLITPLPPSPPSVRMAITFRVPNPAVVNAREAARIEARRIIAERASSLSAQVEKYIDQLLKQLRGQLDARKVDERGMVRSPHVSFPIRVSPASLDRAIHILREVLHRAVVHGAVLKPLDTSDRYHSGLRFELDGFSFSLQVEEYSTRVAVPPEKRPKRYGGYTLASDAWALRPDGKLTLRYSGPGYGSDSLRDGRRKIEERLEEVLENAFSRVVAEKERKRIEEIRCERAVAYLMEKDKIRQAEEFEARRQRQLQLDARMWRRAQGLRDYVSAVERAGFVSGRACFDSMEAWLAWIAWAKVYVDSVDPIAQGKAGLTPPYPEPKEITEIPRLFLDYDDPAEADKVLRERRWLY